MTQAALLFLHALSGVHPGSGSTSGLVDLPVQRERHTQWPTIVASSIKGVLRAACRRAGLDNEAAAVLFGPDVSAAHEHAGALSVSDARLIAFPVRSLAGVFAWTTCPAAWSRLVRDANLLDGMTVPPVPPSPSEGAAAVPAATDLRAGASVVLEEFPFAPDGNLEPQAQWLSTHATRDAATQARMARNLAMLPDDDFTHFARHATEVTARIGLDYERRTVRDGALFYEEVLPPETVFYALVFAEDGRSNRTSMPAAEVMRTLRDVLPPVLQIGAGQTIGRGLCAASVWPGGSMRS